MKLPKLSLANIQGKLSRAEMKKIMAGSDNGCATNPCAGHGDGTCKTAVGGCKCSIPQGDADCV